MDTIPMQQSYVKLEQPRKPPTLVHTVHTNHTECMLYAVYVCAYNWESYRINCDNTMHSIILYVHCSVCSIPSSRARTTIQFAIRSIYLYVRCVIIEHTPAHTYTWFDDTHTHTHTKHRHHRSAIY